MMAKKEEGYADDLAEAWDVETALDLDDDKPEDKEPAASYAADLEKTWDESLAKADGSADLAEVFEPYRDTLAKAGMTPRDYVEQLLQAGRLVEANPGVPMHDAMVHAGFQREWGKFTRTNPEAEELRVKMGEHLLTAPQHSGESTRQALARAFKAVTAKPEAKHDWRSAAEKAWDNLGYGQGRHR